MPLTDDQAKALAELAVRGPPFPSVQPKAGEPKTITIPVLAACMNDIEQRFAVLAMSGPQMAAAEGDLGESLSVIWEARLNYALDLLLHLRPYLVELGHDVPDGDEIPSDRAERRTFIKAWFDAVPKLKAKVTEQAEAQR